MGRHRRTGKGKKTWKNAATKPLHITESTNKAYAYIAVLISLSISSTRQFLVGLIELELIGVGVGVGLGLGSGVSVGVCRPMPPYPFSLYVLFVQIQFNSIYLFTFIIKEESKRGYWTREPANLALWTPSGPSLNLPFYNSPLSGPFSPVLCMFRKLRGMTWNEIFICTYKQTIVGFHWEPGF